MCARWRRLKFVTKFGGQTKLQVEREDFWQMNTSIKRLLTLAHKAIGKIEVSNPHRKIWGEGPLRIAFVSTVDASCFYSSALAKKKELNFDTHR